VRTTPRRVPERINDATNRSKRSASTATSSIDASHAALRAEQLPPRQGVIGLLRTYIIAHLAGNWYVREGYWLLAVGSWLWLETEGKTAIKKEPRRPQEDANQ
jgi:hypothetical protein